jgi:hypothetical protein
MFRECERFSLTLAKTFSIKHPPMILPEYKIQELSDGKFLVILEQEGEAPTQFIVDPTFALRFGRDLAQRALGRTPESVDDPLTAVL